MDGRSWVRTVRPSAAAHARMVGSSAVRSPMSCTRTRSRSGCRRNRPRSTSSLKSASLASRSTIFLHAGAAGEQLLAEARPAGLCRLDLAPDFSGQFLPLTKVLLDLLCVVQIVADDRIHVREAQTIKPLHNCFRSSPIQVRLDDQFQEHPCIAYSDCSRIVLAKRYWLCFDD